MKVSGKYFLLAIIAYYRAVPAQGNEAEESEDIDDESHSIRFNRQSSYWRNRPKFETSTSTVKYENSWSQNTGGSTNYWSQNNGGSTNSWSQNAGESWNSWPTGDRQQYNNANLPDCPPEEMEDEEPEFGKNEFYAAAKPNNFINCKPYVEQNWPSRPSYNDNWNAGGGQRYSTTQRSFTRLNMAPTKAPFSDQETVTMRRSGYYRPGTQAPPMPTPEPGASAPNYKYYNQNQMRQPYVASSETPFFGNSNELPPYPTKAPNYPTEQPTYPTERSTYLSQPQGYPTNEPSYPAQRPGYPNERPGYPTDKPGYPTPPPTKYAPTSTIKYGPTKTWQYPRFTEKPVTESYISTKRYPPHGGLENYATPKSTAGLTPPYNPPITAKYTDSNPPITNKYPDYKEPITNKYPDYKEPITNKYPDYKEPITNKYPDYKEPITNKYPDYKEPITNKYPDYKEPITNKYPDSQEPITSKYSYPKEPSTNKYPNSPIPDTTKYPNSGPPITTKYPESESASQSNPDDGSEVPKKDGFSPSPDNDYVTEERERNSQPQVNDPNYAPTIFPNILTFSVIITSAILVRFF